jgi:hypothetical protein
MHDEIFFQTREETNQWHANPFKTNHPTSHLQSKMEDCMVEIEGYEGFRLHLGH